MNEFFIDEKSGDGRVLGKDFSWISRIVHRNKKMLVPVKNYFQNWHRI